MSTHITIVLLGAICAATLSVAAVVYRPRSVPQWSFLVAIGLLAVEGFFQLFSLDAVSMSEMLFWQRAATIPAAGLSLAWLLFSLTYARGNARQFLRQWWLVLIGLGVIPLLLALWGWRDLVTDVVWTAGSGHWHFPVSFTGKMLQAALVLSSVLVLHNLESTFRSAVGTARWKIKYAVFGLSLWCGARIYTSSQVVLYATNSVNLVALNASAVLLASVFFAVSLYRAKLSHVDIYPSPTALHRSFTFILAGIYLVAVGLLAKAVSLRGGAEDFPLAAMVILVGLSGLGIFSLSDRVRNSTKQFVSRHFKRPSHDYRKVWTTITQRTVAVLDREELSRRMVGAIADTFEALSVTIWLADASNNRFVFAASTSLHSRDAASVPVADTVYRELAALSADSIQPVDLDRSDEKWCALLKESNPSLFPEIGGHRLCMPLVFGGELAGLLVMGDRVRGVPFTVEDLELLKCLGDQMAAALCTLNLSEKLVRAKEMEAFQVMSAFLVHDLKNTASALSLTLRNLPVHFDNPAFREDALRTLSRSVQRVNELIGRLSTLRQKLELQRRPTDVNQLVAAALKSVGDLPQINLVPDCQPLPIIPVDAAQIESVIVNLLLNAREAISGPGEIHITTRSQEGDVLLTVRDNGCGISPEFIAESLFKPFKTSKKTGLGIGMYQTKTVVDAHGGRITVESEVGQGTTFRVLLPSQAGASNSA